MQGRLGDQLVGAVCRVNDLDAEKGSKPSDLVELVCLTVVDQRRDSGSTEVAEAITKPTAPAAKQISRVVHARRRTRR